MSYRSIARAGLCICVVTCAILASLGQEAATSPPTRIEDPTRKENGVHEQLENRDSRYQLHPDDVLELTFPFTPEFNQTVTVQPDGYISLRGVDSIRVKGQSLPQLSDSLQKEYRKIMHDPVIDIELKDFQKPFFIVGGEVGHPGKYDLRGETTTSEAVAIAGGLKESAKGSNLLLFHRVQNGWLRARKVNLERLLKHASLDEDAYLQPGDFLYVPRSSMSKYSRFIPTSSLGMYTNPVLH
jgi:protein involved in polysaccharide export with SLBB domain